MIQVLLVSNKNEDSVKKVEEAIKAVGSDYFINVNVIVTTEEHIDSFVSDCDFVVSLLPTTDVSGKKVINATSIVTGSFNEKTEKDILNQLLRYKVRDFKNRE